MKKQLVVLVAAIALVSLALVPALAGESGPAGDSNVGHVYLYQREFFPPYNFIEDGPWGKMTYTLRGAEFGWVFNAHGLEAGSSYTLIYTPGGLENIICLGEGEANDEGDFHSHGARDTGDLDGQIWLAWSKDVSCEDGTTFFNFEYLLSTTTIQFEDTSP